MVLIVVDMQPGVEVTKYGGIVDRVANEVRQAVLHGMPVLFLEFQGFGKTFAELTALVADHSQVEFRSKKQMGGGREVVSALADRGWTHERLRVCGVETFHCVAETVEQLVELLPGTQVDVVGEACQDRVIGWGMFPSHPNIHILEA